MKTGWVVIAIFCVAVLPVPAQESAASRAADTRRAPTTRAERVAAIDQEFDDAMTAFTKAYEEAKTDADKQKVESGYPKPEAWHARLFAIAKEDPKGEGGEAALEWITSHSRHGKDFAEALALLARDHVQSPTVKKAFDWLEYAEDPEPEAFLRTMTATSPHRDVQALAAYTLAKLLHQLAESVRFLSDADAELLKRSERHYGADEFSRRTSMDPARLEKESEETFVLITQKFADVPRGGESHDSLGQRAERFLFEIRNLGIGKTAPEIQGEDVDGKPMKLSDFRGKVVLLDFWGHW